MTIAFDAATASGEFRDVGNGDALPYTFTHTPVGTPAAVVLLITHAAITSADVITGAVTYGGVAMTRVPTDGFAQDTAAEVGGAYCYELLSGIPTGPQVVSITYDGSTNPMKKAVCVTMTSATGLAKRVASGHINGDAANPSITMDSGTDVALRLVALYSGQDAIASVTDGTGLTRILGEKLTQGNYCRLYGRQTTPASGSVALGFTATSDDVAMVGAAYAEKASPGGSDPMGMMGFFGQ